MDIEGLGQDLIEDAEYGVRSKTSLRMHYEAQVQVIRSQIGGLESVRGTLGLSQRKISQLLLVDPSAWTRWTKQGDMAPPHIWRALQWYMALKEHIPGLTPQYFLGSNPQVLHQKALQGLENERQERLESQKDFLEKMQALHAEKDSFNSEIKGLKKDLNFHKKISIVILLTSLCGWALALWFWKGL